MTDRPPYIELTPEHQVAELRAAILDLEKKLYIAELNIEVSATLGDEGAVTVHEFEAGALRTALAVLAERLQALTEAPEPGIGI